MAKLGSAGNCSLNFIYLLIMLMHMGGKVITK